MTKDTMNISPRNRNTKDTSPQRDRSAYPLNAYLNFVPGGIDYKSEGPNKHSSPPQSRSNHYYALNAASPEILASKAYNADTLLRKYAIRYANRVTKKDNDTTPVLPPHRLPSLSILAEAAFAPLTGVHATSVRKWADAMVLAYLDENDNSGGRGVSSLKKESVEEIETILRASEEDLLQEYQTLQKNDKNGSLSTSPTGTLKSPQSPSPSSPSHKSNDLVNILKTIHQQQIESTNQNDTILSPMPIRPCGYVFKRNDIAWNCRTCQSDATCVICDSCFHASDHEGHEVYFHRTSPGGCCDCGDAEAWKSEGCCPKHRPREFNDVCPIATTTTTNTTTKDVDMSSIPNSSSGVWTEEKLDFEAVKASLRGRSDGELCVKEMLPPRLAASLGVVIGSAIHSIVQAIDGSSIGADPVQWTRRWADQLRKVKDGRPFDEEYVMSGEKETTAKSLSEAMKLDFPSRFKLHLRLHNDDIHTYEEVTDALHSQRRGFNPTPKKDDNDEMDTTFGIVDGLDKAKEMTSRVDSDGQVLIRGYSTMDGALAGFDRLKKFGLHCAVVSSPQIDLELRARILLSWLSDIVDAHPAVSALVVHALVDVTEGLDSFGETCVWGNSRMIPPWSFSQGYLSSSRVSIQENGQEEKMNIPGWRRRMDVFPPNLQSSFLTREECHQLHSLGRSALNETSSPRKGM